MMPSQPGRVRVIRFLILVLALTASRANFPLLKPTLSASDRDAATLKNQTSKTVARGEGVTPSRRHLESQRSDWPQARAFDPGSQSFHRELFRPSGGALRLAGLPADRSTELCAALARPEYLNLFGQAATSTSLSPPA
jgi:hypothetical protein